MILGLGLGLAAMSAHAATLDAHFVSTSDTYGTATGLANTGVAQSFTIENSGTLASVEMLIARGSDTVTDPLTIGLHSVSGTSIGSLLASVEYAATDTGVGIANAVWLLLDLTPLNYAVTAGEMFAVSALVEAGTHYTVSHDSSANGPTYAGGSRYGRNSTTGDFNQFPDITTTRDFSFRVFVETEDTDATDETDEDLSPVPLPATGLLLLGALAGLGRLRRRG